MEEQYSKLIEYPPEEMKISFMLASCLVWGFFLSYIFYKWGGITTIAEGAKVGAVMAIFLSLSSGLGMMAMFKFTTLANVGIDVVANAICTAITGAAIGYGMNKIK